MIDHGLAPYGGPAIRTRPRPTYGKGDAFISVPGPAVASPQRLLLLDQG